MSRRTPARDRVTVENVNVPGHTVNLDAAKYEAMRKALVAVLPKEAPGLTQAEIRQAVRPHLSEHFFPAGATANWWAKTVQLDLEAKEVIDREATKPIRWHLRKTPSKNTARSR